MAECSAVQHSKSNVRLVKQNTGLCGKDATKASITLINLWIRGFPENGDYVYDTVYNKSIAEIYNLSFRVLKVCWLRCQCGNVENVESEGYLVSETACLRQKVSERRIAASAVQTCPVIAQDTIIFNSAITACEKGRQWQASLCLLERLDRPLNGLFSHSRRLPVSIVRNMEIRVLVAGVGISAL